MVEAQMKKIAAVGHKPHSIDRRKYGQPYVALYYANRRAFAEPGIYLWLVSRNVRVLPLPRSSS